MTEYLLEGEDSKEVVRLKLVRKGGRIRLVVTDGKFHNGEHEFTVLLLEGNKIMRFYDLPFGMDWA